jgi:hypothetical protein
MFLLSVFNETVSRVLIRFCSYKLEFYHECFSDSQKTRINLPVCEIKNRIETCSAALSKGNLRVFMERNPANGILN